MGTNGIISCHNHIRGFQLVDVGEYQLVLHALDVVMINPVRSAAVHRRRLQKKKAPLLRHDGHGPRQGGVDILLSDGAGGGVDGATEG